MRLENISKPKIVDFLRVCDRKNWVYPRIRYASVRSKPTLLKDIRAHFEERQGDREVELIPFRDIARLPRIQYDFDKKAFLFDGQTIDLPKVGKVEFQILKGPIVVDFGRWTPSPAPPSSCEAPVCPSQTPRTRSSSDSSDQNLPSCCYSRTPSSTPFGPLSLGTRSRADNPDFFEPSY